MRVTWTLVTLLMAAGFAARAADKPGDPTPDERKEREKKVATWNREGSRLYAAHDFARARELFSQALEMGRSLYPKSDFPNGHPELAASMQNLAVMRLVMGEYAEAEQLLREALRMNRALYSKTKYPRGHPFLAANVNWLAELYVGLGDYSEAEPFARETLAMYRALYPKEDFPHGHDLLHQAITGLALIYREAGDYGKAEPLLREALDTARAQYPNKEDPLGQMVIGGDLANLASLLQRAGEYGKAESLFKEALEMRRARFPKDKFPQGHRALAQSIGYLAELYWFAGQYTKAVPLCEEALQMGRALLSTSRYPGSRHDFVVLISIAAALHQALGEYDKAEALKKEALDINRAAFPKEKYPLGHPDLATSLSNLAALHKAAGEYAKAEPIVREALDMNRALYPREKYPQGHPDLAKSIINLASLYWAEGRFAQAEPLLSKALDMNQRLLREYAELAAEAECLNYVAQQPLTRDAFLSVSRHLPDKPTYDAVWGARAILTRLQERRHRDLMVSNDPDTAELAQQLHVTRLSLSRRLLKPLPDADRQRAAVQKLTDAKEDLEKRIAQKLKLAALQPMTTPPVQRLVDSLSAEAAFVDFYRYTDFEQGPKVKGKNGEKRTPRYVAFVVRRSKDVARVELGEASPIEGAWAAWRQTLMAPRSEEQVERQSAAALAKLIWGPLRKELPASLKTVYLTPDGVLHQVPWAALPGRQPNTVLLEEHAICLAPHGPFLLERLEQAAPDAGPAGALLALGGVDYEGAPEAANTKGQEITLRGAPLGDKVRWTALQGTDIERRQIAELAQRAARLKVAERSGKTASTEQLQRDLPAVRYAHVATHGFFADPRFRSALQIDPKQFERATQDRRGGARSPLALSGLVLAGANRTGQDMADDRGILTAEGIIGLRLEGLELAVLSACETGLGEWGGGEGVYGLQRAFHVAGCQSVVASLWKVDDQATQALMALFYRNLWEKKLDAAEALRQAQLALYRHPEAIQVAQRRGFDFSERDLPKGAVEPGKPKHAPTAYWAAFTFSGVRPAPAKGQ
jgi:CHAT domain-containing protein